MEQIFETQRVTRANIISLVEAFSAEQLNHIPEGYNNNLAWNLGHLLVTQQLLVYRLSGLPGYLSDELIDRYRKGTKPEAPISDEEVATIKEQLLTLVDQTATDWAEGKFGEYKEYPTSFGVTLRSTADAMQFNNSHEALHLGYMMAMKKLV
ncbi:MAG: DinB family protein [Cyclobacteriaceae bacterium]